MKKTTKRIVIGVAAFVAVICGLSSLVVTKENEYTLIMRFGKINSIKTANRHFQRKFFCMIWQRRMSSQRIRKR